MGLAMTQNPPKKFAVCSFYEHSRFWKETMKQDWHPDELAQHWTLSPDECELVGNKTGATRLSFAVLLKAELSTRTFCTFRRELSSLRRTVSRRRTARNVLE